MRKALIVGRNEYLRAVRSKAFVIGVLFTPLLMGVAFLIGKFSEMAKDVDDRRFAIVDRGDGRLAGELLEAALRRDATEVFDPRAPAQQVEPRFVGERVDPGDPAAAAGLELRLSERVRQEELFGYLILGPGLHGEGEGGEGDGGQDGNAGRDRTFAWHTAAPTYDDLPEWIESVVNDVLRRSRYATAGIDVELVQRLDAHEPLRRKGLVRTDELTGALQEAEESDDDLSVVIAVAFTILMTVLVMSAGPTLLNAVLEEKMQKIAEVLVSSVSPFELMLGKLISVVLQTLTLAAIWVGAALVWVHYDQGMPPAVQAAFTPALLGWFAAFLVLGLVTWGAIGSAFGAACNEMQDAQHLMGPLMLVLMLPTFFIAPVIESPDSTLARVVSLFPPATPVLMMLRVALPPGPAWWELVLALVLTTAFTALCVWAGGRIFRMGILAQGQTPTFRNLWQWMRAG